MTATLRIQGFKGSDDFARPELPLAIGVSHDGSLLIGEGAEPTAAAWLGDKEGEIFLQPAPGQGPVKLNDRALQESAWLESGDTISIGSHSIRVAKSGAEMVLSPVEGKSPGESADGGRTEGDDQKGGETPRGPQIAPVRPIGPIRERKTRGWKSLLVFFALLVSGAAFVLIAAPVRVTITPEPESVSLDGFWPVLPFVGRYLALPGKYLVQAEKSGYRKLEQEIDVVFGSEIEVQFKLIELPGYLDVVSRPVQSASVFIDGKEMGRTPVTSMEVEAGRRELRVLADRYIPFKETIEVRGKGNRQTKEVTLEPGWGILEITSEPTEAEVWLSGKKAGLTPIRLEPMGGSHRIELRKSGWKTLSQDVKVKANQTVKLPLLRLEKADGILNLTTVPTGANVNVNGILRGSAPIQLELKSGNEHKVTIEKAGYETVSRTVRLDGDKPQSLKIELKAQYGIVFLNTRPAGAKLKVDGKDWGSASQRLRLTTAPHQLEISKPGYLTQSMTVTPRPAISKSIEVRLEKVPSPQAKVVEKGTITVAGQRLRLIEISKPVRFKVGASRREAGRRSNETQHRVELTRSFYISEKEVTNSEFRKFKSGHDSGTERGVSLNKPSQPVVSVSWEDAARYLNWLSRQEGLPPAYQEKNGKMVAVEPMTNGYRLPTEAEWVFAARYEGGQRSADKPLKYPWGDNMPPPKNSGNYADKSASGRLPVTIEGYSDGHLYAAPVGKYSPNGAGIYDLGGNVAEWIHDYYYVYTGGSQRVLRDPVGPKTGDLHVVRGASWRHGGITELRLSYRDYTLKPRNDIGFRVVRYATKKPE